MISDQTSSLSKVSVRFIKTLHSLLATKQARSVWQRGHYTDSLLHLVVQSGITGVRLILALADISATKYKDADFHPSVYPDHGCGVCSLRRPSSSSHLIQQTGLKHLAKGGLWTTLTDSSYPELIALSLMEIPEIHRRKLLFSLLLISLNSFFWSDIQ